MKYMGSKRSLLANGLGDTIISNSENSARLVDLMCGAASVAWFAADNLNLPVLAADSQLYATILAHSVISRTEIIDPIELETNWLDIAVEQCHASEAWRQANQLTLTLDNMQQSVATARAMCDTILSIGPIWHAYGGHYFSPNQAVLFDYLIDLLPTDEPERSICLSSVIVSASKCVAAPGHTAQPLQPTLTGAQHVLNAWLKNPVTFCRAALREICSKHARARGNTATGDIDTTITYVRPDDLVIVDLPYSGVQYSRFYHVLETIARGDCGPVTGVGRYPAYDQRPQSCFSNIGQSQAATERLLCSLSQSGCKAIFTFPSNLCSNGLSGEWIANSARNFFDVSITRVNVQHSTLGGKPTGRQARRHTEEMIIVMEQRRIY